MTLATPPPSLVVRIEQAEETHVVRQAEAVQTLYPSCDVLIQHQSVAGGVAIRTVPRFEGKLSRIVGLGLQGSFTSQDLCNVEFESTYAAIGLSPEIHLCEYADPSAGQVLTRARYFSKGRLSVYCMDLEDSDESVVARKGHPKGKNITVREVASDVDRAHFVAVSIAGFADGGRWEELLGALARIAALRADTRLYIATTDAGKVVGTAALAVLGTHTAGENIGHLYLDSTVPLSRGMGAHVALIQARLRAARGMVLKLVTLSTREGSGSAKMQKRPHLGWHIARRYMSRVELGPQLGGFCA
ncbi:hypothetical protein ASPACDRAFT_1889455 [Aspergillus aculeatus ATCC 16872]|uniref:N-acetyltransferase domain-containing protein n=1 Tax=Aspergillus aculeatus (strain ATCC 16872 / CBS 172.66 / WB 5094) TaxID=690307 RepID=A0A1L9WQ51_ASPA1|nr:uncharacterized protein ASPACDRAFT_1889455 [Aspergillus aculeatus ATCC 16872]OJJ98187.1 hypothetical protein ASPACDRAFT_1889455 [Aspergillus aculeatus ATCC 16872]